MDWGKLIEQKIREAQEAGAFDRLPQKDQLDLAEDNQVPDPKGMRLAYHVLKSQGFAPEWIEQDKELRARLDQARQAVARSWLWYRKQSGQATGDEARRLADDEWQRARERFEADINLLNKEVFNHNLRVPSVQLQRLPLRLSEEYQALGIN